MRINPFKDRRWCKRAWFSVRRVVLNPTWTASGSGTCLLKYWCPKGRKTTVNVERLIFIVPFDLLSSTFPLMFTFVRQVWGLTRPPASLSTFTEELQGPNVSTPSAGRTGIPPRRGLKTIVMSFWRRGWGHYSIEERIVRDYTSSNLLLNHLQTLVRLAPILALLISQKSLPYLLPLGWIG